MSQRLKSEKSKNSFGGLHAADGSKLAKKGNNNFAKQLWTNDPKINFLLGRGENQSF